MIRALWLLVMCLWSCSSSAFPAEEIRLDPDTRYTELYPHLYYQLMDSETGVEDIIFEPARQHAFIAIDKPNQALRAYPKVLWFFSRLTYTGQKPRPLS